MRTLLATLAVLFALNADASAGCRGNRGFVHFRGHGCPCGNACACAPCNCQGSAPQYAAPVYFAPPPAYRAGQAVGNVIAAPVRALSGCVGGCCGGQCR